LSRTKQRPTILVTGKTGQVGFELFRAFSPLGRVRDFVRSVKPSLIVNPAAYTDVDRAETDPSPARAVNSTAPGILAQEAAKLGIPIVHFSTDYVFDGTKTEPYTEDDAPNPVSIYGETKLAGEEAVRASGAMFVTLRLSWVYSLRGRNFLCAMLDLAKEGGEIRVADDQVGAPCWARMAAEAVVEIASRLLNGVDRCGGVYHVPAGGRTSRFGFAQEIFKMTKGRPGVGEVELRPAATSEIGTGAKRPAFSVMSGEKLEASFGIRLPDWKEQLEMALEAYP
jgi:dTDP-4-dehydrorhamnose reductase